MDLERVYGPRMYVCYYFFSEHKIKLMGDHADIFCTDEGAMSGDLLYISTTLEGGGRGQPYWSCYVCQV